MFTRTMAAVAAGSLLAVQCLPAPARAENQMGYRLLAPQEAASLPRNSGSLGLDVERSQQITDGGMTFDIIRVKRVVRGSPGARAGFSPGDQIIAVNGMVFSSINAFAAYVGSTPPGTQVTVDYIPSGGGPQQAQRVAVEVGGAGRPNQMPPRQEPAPSTGMSTGSKIAIGVGAAALLGCYEMGCFSRKPTTNAGTNAGRPSAVRPLQQGYGQQPYNGQQTPNPYTR